ncbi:amidohydrolase family protein [Desulfospira joergensenii]|uniref:amidohydrolase family protein n=1 Tax=Desulfospira joergensenii TaxID=53329 RepID=UPI0003B5B7BB|nr:amidohydrolase family protein [Desulfospira joergensenii]
MKKKTHTLLVKNARLIDGLGNVFENLQSIYIHGGQILEIGNCTCPDHVPMLDVKGATVMPGLIDAHVHLQSVPGSVFRNDDEAQLKTYRYHQLKSYLACGVTTVLDNAISSQMLGEFSQHLTSGGTGPRIFALAPGFYPPNGYLDNDMLTPFWGPHWQPAKTRTDVAALFREYEGMDNIIGVKAMIESGFGKANIWPLLSSEIRNFIVDEAGKRNLPLYVHAYKKKEQEIGLDMGVHCFVHSGFIFKQPTDRFISRMKKLGTYMTTTLSCTFDQMLVQFERERLDNPYLKLRVPGKLLETARDDRAWEDYYDRFFTLSSPRWLPGFVIRALPKVVNIEKSIRSCMQNASRAILTLYKAGIPIVAGTDASSWPVFPNFFHGTSMIREMELLCKIGIPPMDVISSATKIPAEMMGLSDRIGTIERGKYGDMIVVREDPLKNPTALESLMWTIKGGDARTPEAWMTDDPA